MPVGSCRKLPVYAQKKNATVYNAYKYDSCYGRGDGTENLSYEKKRKNKKKKVQPGEQCHGRGTQQKYTVVTQSHSSDRSRSV